MSNDDFRAGPVNLDPTLLPCPFCGVHPALHEYAGTWHVDCVCNRECIKTREEAVTFWNTRAEPAPVEQGDCKHGFRITPVDPSKPSFIRNCKIVAGDESPVMRSEDFRQGSVFTGNHFEATPAEQGDDPDDFPEEAFNLWVTERLYEDVGVWDAARWGYARIKAERDAAREGRDALEIERNGFKVERDAAWKRIAELEAERDAALNEARMARSWARDMEGIMVSNNQSAFDARTARAAAEAERDALAEDYAVAQESVKELEGAVASRLPFTTRLLDQSATINAIRAENEALRASVQAFLVESDNAIGHQVACHDCGLAYGGEGWCDVGVPDDVWKRISPTGDEGGILCFTCMARRLSRAGLEGVPAAIRSGPWECRDDDLNTKGCADDTP